MTRENFLKKGEKKEDYYLLSSIWDKRQECLRRKKVGITSFLDEYQQKIVQKAIQGMKDVSFAFWGGYDKAERTVGVLYPINLGEEEKEKWKRTQEELKVIRIVLPKHEKEEVNHRRYLGAIMKLGVERQMVGDILVGETGADIIVKKEIVPFLKNNLPMLTRFQKATVTIQSLEELRKVEKQIDKSEIIVSSMRADAIVAELIHTSRTKAVEYIKQERIFVNSEPLKKITKNLQIGDKITVRGKGRFYLMEKVRESKSGRIVLSVGRSL